MEKISSAFILGLLSSAAVADVPNTFVPGEVATAAKFNENFTHLSDEIKDVKAKVNGLADGSGEASENASPLKIYSVNVNGVDMRAYSTRLGLYSVITPTEITITVDADGYPINNDNLVYESEDCTGQAYKAGIFFGGHEDKPLGHIFTNPKFPDSTSIVYLAGFLGYTDNELVKLNYSSINYGGRCVETNGTQLALRVLPNDPKVTGIDSMPLVITGIGEDLRISSREIGVPRSGGQKEERDVYANGEKIGTTSSISSYYNVLNSIRVYLNDGSWITLYKDGSYSGKSVVSDTFYYRSSDCSGTPYAFVAAGADTKWLDVTQWKPRVVENQGVYYQLSEQLYRTSRPFLSRRLSYRDSCDESTTYGSGQIYAAATLTDDPEIPVFTPPITIEGYSEPTPFDSLPEAL